MQVEEHDIVDRLVIPPQPEVLRVVVAESRKEDPDLGRIARHIAGDASIAGGVLQIVNSPLFRRAREISSIPQAVMLLGFNRIYAIVRTVALRNAMAQYPGMEAFWRRGVHVAESAARAARVIKRPDLVDEAHLLGLFHMVGIPALCSLAGDDYVPLVKAAPAKGWSTLLPEETRLFGIHHPRVGALITQRWHIPQAVVHAIDQQYAVDQVAHLGSLHEDVPDLVVILKLALRFATAVDASLMTYAEWGVYSEQLADYLALPDPAALDTLVDGVAALD
ncbi:HDOD domain-containing protein [Ectothiorhodospira lacustris]|uniref:HDOD domain-containing protein n=1 Tax=Ectothiorhodospira lacustris TaxID=2899127 RepID=UPI001EE889BC|nr:HDOD domain-containing protein [Ectothiorhodospira lacustris]MCG5499489.1 HDOD domain-containing protein [Ectothiorhodospira lacustris]MCG5511067.1 HDOD domain-containing protein [Ectothiorhodospira lacustris]MCG5522925.1 HDOD domain-containing protein [Ectothiorhodospira lacustris]